MKELWVILGAPDPEMEAIEALAKESGARVLHAYDKTGRRVHPGSAYATEAVIDPATGQEVDLTGPSVLGRHVAAVECAGPAIPGWAQRIDHHHPGDPGYGKGPEEFFVGSSLGQFVRVLAGRSMIPRSWDRRPAHFSRSGEVRIVYDWQGVAPAPCHVVTTCMPFPEQYEARVPDDLLMVAAADHCLAAAYAKRCPGIDPERLLKTRAMAKAAFQKRPVEQVIEDLSKASLALMTAKKIRLGKGTVADLRGTFVPELPEAAAAVGIAFLAAVKDRDQRTKVVLQAATEDQILEFMHEWGPAQGLEGIYGDPARGFAGGYIKKEEGAH